MLSSAWVAEMARYNAWQNGVLYDICDGLAPDVRDGDRGLFFGSISHTLDHILMVDRFLLGTVKGEKQEAFSPKRRLFADWADLKHERTLTDHALIGFADTTPDDFYASSFTVWSESLQKHRTVIKGLLVAQMFNHQTHHRSQATSELHRLGIDYGVTDMPFRPDTPG